jgi:predicted RNA-binding Zn ribbon-like protein
MGTVDQTFGRRVGGRVCLDFVNTVGGRGGPEPGELRDDRLDSYAALVSWGRFTGVLTQQEVADLLAVAQRRSGAASAVLERGLVLREAVYGVFRAVAEGSVPGEAEMAVLNEELRVAGARALLVMTPEPEWGWDADPAALDRMLWPVARSAAELLTSPARGRVRQCPGESCGWLFLDESRSGRRRWCDMADCGNIEKVRRFRRRRAATD